MKRNHQWTAVWNGETITDSLTGWATRTNKSRTFLTDMIHEASQKGIEQEKIMQWAIEQVPGKRRVGAKKINIVRRDSARATYEEVFRNEHRDVINNFLYSR